MRRCLPWFVALFALAGCGEESTSRQPEPIRVRIVDREGKPASWAQVLLRRVDKDVASKWDAEKAMLILPRESAPHGIRVASVGHRLLVVNDIRDDRTITLPRGLVVRIALENTSAQTPEPRAILLRIRPWVAGDPSKSAALSAKITQLCDLMYLATTQAPGSLPVLPTENWGFGVSPTDAANGIYIPTPGSYVVHWGLLDLNEGTWYTVEEGAALRIEV